MTLDDLLKFNKETDAFDYVIVKNTSDSPLGTCYILTPKMVFVSKDNPEVIKTQKVQDIVIPGIIRKEQKGIIVEV